MHYYMGDTFGLLYKLWSSLNLSRYQGEWIDLFFNRFRQLSTQLHPGYSSLPGHVAQDICLCYFPTPEKITEVVRHCSQIWRGSANTKMTVGLFLLHCRRMFCKLSHYFQSGNFRQYDTGHIICLK